MSTIQLEEPLTAGGIRAINFFNGRLLSGEDLTHEQAMNLLAHRRFGRAIGAGVAFGLEVEKNGSQSTASNPIVSVKRGLALNREGQTLWLENDTDLAIIRTAESGGTSGKVFSDCAPCAPGVSVSGDGAYLLVISPAAKNEGKAPVSGLGNVPASCNSRYTTSGVKFRLLKLPLDSEFGDPNKARNRVAYRCFGTAAEPAFFQNPFRTPTLDQGLPDDVRPTGLTACDVPLAVLSWRTSAIQFVDQWSVRRRITCPTADRDWPLLLSDQRVSRAEAMFFQFQEQIEDLRISEPTPASIVASDRFAFLPPIGFLPIATSGLIGGFADQTFFKNKVHREPVFIEGAQVVFLMQEALAFPPVDISSSEMVWLYMIRENKQAPNPSPPQTYTIFVNGHTAYRGAARYDLNRWDFSNYGD